MSEGKTTKGEGKTLSVQTGTEPPADPEFFLKWGQENAKEFIKTANAALAQLLTLSTALFGGAIALWNNIPIPTPYRIVVLAPLLFTVFVCLFSAMPKAESIDPTDAKGIQTYMEKVFAYKQKRLALAKWSLVVAMVFIVAALVAAQYLLPPIAPSLPKPTP
ncbi:hypothetical protein [Rhizobium sp. 18055]|uniref:hypothetical protein n=1 Tax=Rhizobium sp. 18055 TaxID=2681403 RepID=UPI00135B2CEE|nr:hypothetical protein [Rhizobium sp. 18055]